MNLDEFKKQLRGPRTFDCWEWSGALETSMGAIRLTLSARDDELPPDQSMVEAATELCAFVQKNANRVLDLLYAHYRLAEAEDWLSFWDVPAGETRASILGFVDGIELAVSRTANLIRPFDLCLSAHVRWDQEHGFHLNYWNGAFVSVNDDETLLRKLDS